MNKHAKRLITLGMIGIAITNTTVMAAETPYFYTKENVVMVPVRDIAESLGFNVEWYQVDERVVLENGKTKMTFEVQIDAYHKSSGRLSEACIMMYPPKELGESPAMKEGKVYVPAQLFDYALDETNVLQVQDNQMSLKEGLQLTYYKKQNVQIDDREYSLSINLPEYIGPYMTLESQYVVSEETRYPICLLTFENEEGRANIGTFSLFTENQYERLKKEGGPVPTQILARDNYIVTFSGLQDMPFELDTKAAEMVKTYHENIDEILKTVIFQLEQ